MFKQIAFLCLTLATAQSLAQTSAGRYSGLVDEGYSHAAAGRHKEAVSAFESALKISPQDGQIWAALGQSAKAAGDHQAVIRAADQVISLGAFGAKVKAVAHFEKACALVQLGRKEEGWKSLGNAMKAGLRSLDQVRAEKRLEPLHSHKGWADMTASHDVKKLKREEGWRYDLKLLDRELRRIHIAPYLHHSPKERDDMVKKISQAIPKASDEEVMAAFYRYTASFGDGHTAIRPPEIKRPRLQAFLFEEGVFITLAAPEHRELAGAQILKVEGRPIEEVADLMKPLMSTDNPMNVKSFIPGFCLNPTLLKGVGVSKRKEEVALTIKLISGEVKEAILPVSADLQTKPDWVRPISGPLPLTLKRRQEPYWFEELPDHKAVYLQYNEVRSDSKESLASFFGRFFLFVDQKKTERIILDVRWNGGGNTFLSQPFIKSLAARPHLGRSGSLYVITGRNTFSAAQNFTTDLGRLFEPIYVGEPSGSSPNFIGESIPFTLPYSGMRGTISDLYWQRSWPMDDRIWIAPELPAPPTFAAYREGRDPAMEAILEQFAQTKG